MGENTSWADLNRDGRRLEKIIKICEKNIEAENRKTPIDDNRLFGYMDRLSRLTHNKAEIADLVLGVRKMLRKAEKVYAQ